MLTRYRRLTHEALSRLSLTGRVLDLGGSKRSDYWRYIKGSPTITAVNVDAKAQPDVTWDLEKFPYPFEDASYDAVIAINLLEHLWHWKELLSESRRVLVRNGTVVIVVPFLHPVHGSPRDFFRYTADALARALSDAGFTDVSVQEIGVGVLSARVALLHRFLPSILIYPFEFMAAIFDAMLARLTKLLGRKYDPAEYALGYIATGKNNNS